MNEKWFVSTVEAKNYPFYATQYHPEKNPFEWDVPAPHSEFAIRATFKMSLFFNEEAKKS